ncbi:hypothetical protein F0562_020842 [Nyssa sinensis]|uniref:Uncharacterized protein n=1 Tax=Nyssa sinensis TaxID=561372 RepID=A0A5J5BVA8_9ASTE|nr:hypothetical protein F0562_020842 [Nyssa sinensis]
MSFKRSTAVSCSSSQKGAPKSPTHHRHCREVLHRCPKSSPSSSKLFIVNPCSSGPSCSSQCPLQARCCTDSPSPLSSPLHCCRRSHGHRVSSMWMQSSGITEGWAWRILASSINGQ